MSNGDEYSSGPAFPGPDTTHHPTSLTKRELFAAMAMQGLSASTAYAESPPASVAAMAVDQADALLAALEKQA